MSVWHGVIRCETLWRVGRMMVIKVLPKALEPAAILFRCHRRPAVSFSFVCIFQNAQCLTITSPPSSVSETQWKLLLGGGHVSVMSRARVQRGKVFIKRLKKEKRKKVGMAGEAGRHFIFECREFSICRFSAEKRDKEVSEHRAYNTHTTWRQFTRECTCARDVSAQTNKQTN